MTSMNVLCVLVPKQHGTAHEPMVRAVRAIGVLSYAVLRGLRGA